MKTYDKRMAVLVLVLLVLLTLKSLVIDPVQVKDTEMNLYRQYAVLAAPYQGSRTPPPDWLYTYRAVGVEKTGSEGKTVIAVWQTGSHQLMEVELPGQYRAQVRAYLLYILPVKNIRVEGGLEHNGSDT